MPTQQIVQLILEVILSALAAYVVKALGKMTTSIEQLNMSMAKIVERTETHKEALDKHDERIRRLEITKPQGE